MKKYALLSMVFTATCLTCFAAETDFHIQPKPGEMLSQDVKVVQLNSLTHNDLMEIMQGQHPELAVEFPACTHLPISFYLKGDLVNLAENGEKWGTVEIKQTFYARCVGEALILSSNLTDWKPFLEFITGRADVTFCIQADQPAIVVGSETNRRL